MARQKFNSMGNLAERQWITDKIHENSRVASASKVQGHRSLTLGPKGNAIIEDQQLEFRF